MAGKRFVPCTTYIDRCVRLDDGSPLVLAPHQRAFLDHALTPIDGRSRFQTVVHSEPKKSGKTRVAAAVGSWVLNTQGPRAEVLCVGNDYEQSIARVFTTICQIQGAHPALKRRVRKQTGTLLVLVDGSVCRPVALDERGEAGADPSLVLNDEAWGISSEKARRLYDELTVPPTRPLGLRWVSSYAGFSGESTTLEELYTRGLAGTPVDGLPDCYVNGSLFMQWSHVAKMPWQTPAYYAAQRQELRPRAFLRLHENRWVTGSESTWLPLGWEDRVVDRAVVERLPVPGVRYRSFCDNAGGSNDDMVLCIGHLAHGVRVLDGVWSQEGRPPYDPIRAIEKFAGILQRYGCSHTWGDTYGGLYFKSEYAKRGIAYTVCDQTPSQLYEAAEVGFTRGDILLPNHARLIEQLGALVEKGGKIAHKYGGHDDFSVAAAGVLWLLAQDGAYVPMSGLIGVGGPRASAPASPSETSLIWSSTGMPNPFDLRDGAGKSVFDLYDEGRLPGGSNYRGRQ